MDAILEFDDVTKYFRAARGASYCAISGLSFAVRRGEFVSVLGPSGCGKSTLLSLAAGLATPSSGHVRLGGAEVTGPNRQIGFMLQKDLLLPWRTIAGNVAFGMEARNIPRAERRERARTELARCGLDAFADHYPYQLSGGMRQRAALARTLAVDPSLILLDEPFSALDPQTKSMLQGHFSKTIHDQAISGVLITHDAYEAVVMSDRVMLMSGRPGTVVDSLDIDLPDRSDPKARRQHGRTQDYVHHLLDRLQEGALS